MQVERGQYTRLVAVRAAMRSAAVTVLALSCLVSSRSYAVEPVDLELVFAVDASGSVDNEEYALQIGGIAAAFREPVVVEAIAAGARGRIAVAMVVWAGPTANKDMTDWWIVGSQSEATGFAAHIEARPRRVGGGTTGIGSGIAEAITMIENNGITGRRRVVDVSGDGVENAGEELHPAFRDGTTPARSVGAVRAVAEERGITINGLAILSEVPDLDRWYEDHVRVGPGSFVMAASGYRDFAEAMLTKLLREIGTGPSLSSLTVH